MTLKFVTFLLLVMKASTDHAPSISEGIFGTSQLSLVSISRKGPFFDITSPIFLNTPCSQEKFALDHYKCGFSSTTATSHISVAQSEPQLKLPAGLPVLLSKNNSTIYYQKNTDVSLTNSPIRL